MFSSEDFQECWKNVKESQNSTKQTAKKKSFQARLIDQFLVEKDVAPWFRGSSSLQLDGCNALCDALRDDAEQGSVHRTQNCLSLIGIRPRLKTRQIKFLIELSRGSDLAFLWFMMEMHYKTPKPGYSINEQLICSAIHQLDVIPTLRELDRILPVGVEAEVKPSDSQRKSHAKKKFSIFTARSRYSYDSDRVYGKRKYIPKHALPYFEKQNIPPSLKTKSLYCGLPNFTVNFEENEKWRDPKYIVPNENKRWFANYQLSDAKRIVNGMLREEIGNLMDNLQVAALKQSTVDTMCEYHRQINKMEKQMEDEMRKKINNILLNNGKETKEDRLKRFKAQMETQIELQLEKFRKEASFVRQELMLKTISSGSAVAHAWLGSEFDKFCELSPDQVKADCKAKCDTQAIAMQNKEINASILAAQKAKCKNEAVSGGGDTTHANKGCGDGIIQIPSPKTLPICNEKSRSNHSKLSDLPSCYYFGHENPRTPNSSEIFFQAPQKHEPFKFDYTKIFGFQPRDQNEEKHIKRLFLQALDVDIERLTELQETQLTLERATDKCINETLKKYQQYDEEHEDDWPLAQYPKNGKYDPNDKVLMDKMLRDAFDYMKKNPKFVWVQLPDAYKLPMLREWIWCRFGKVYTPKDRHDSYSKSAEIFKALDNTPIAIKPPKNSSLGRRELIDYNCRSYVEKKVKQIHTKYFKKLRQSLLERSNILWYAMRPYLCAGGPPRQTYFAYMPSNVLDIQLCRIWKSSEYRDIRAMWLNRQTQKNLENH